MRRHLQNHIPLGQYVGMLMLLWVATNVPYVGAESLAIDRGVPMGASCAEIKRIERGHGARLLLETAQVLRFAGEFEMQPVQLEYVCAGGPWSQHQRQYVQQLTDAQPLFAAAREQIQHSYGTPDYDVARLSLRERVGLWFGWEPEGALATDLRWTGQGYGISLLVREATVESGWLVAYARAEGQWLCPYRNAQGLLEIRLCEHRFPRL